MNSNSIRIAFLLLSAVEFLRNAPEVTYDAIIVDSSDPIGELMLQCIVFVENSAMECFSHVLVYIYFLPVSLLPIILFLNSMLLYFYYVSEQ